MLTLKIRFERGNIGQKVSKSPQKILRNHLVTAVTTLVSAVLSFVEVLIRRAEKKLITAISAAKRNTY
jgi:hypothetical protein